MYDRTDFEQVIEERLRNIQLVVGEAKASGREYVVFPFFVPESKYKHFSGFKKEVIARIKAQGFNVTDLQGGRSTINGFIKDMHIVWDDEAKEAAERAGYVFM